jgi:hypothetical protein
LDIIRADLLKRKDKGSIELIDALLEKVYNFSDGKSALCFFSDVIMMTMRRGRMIMTMMRILVTMMILMMMMVIFSFYAIITFTYLVACILFKCMYLYMYVCMHVLYRPRPDQHYSDGEFGTTILLRRALLYGTNSRNRRRRR